MRTRYTLWLLPVCLASAAFAQESGTPCDGSVELGVCSVNARPDGNDLLLISSAESCSVVTWSLDGATRTTTVVDQGARIENVTPAPVEAELESRVEVQHCVQVLDERVGRECYAARDRVRDFLAQLDGNMAAYGGRLDGSIKRSEITQYTLDRLKRAFEGLPEGCCVTGESGAPACSLLEYFEASSL